MPERVAVDAGACRDLIVSVLAAHGAPAGNAAIVADHLVEASRMGLHSHGVIRAPQYVDDIAAGRIDAAAEPRLERETGAIALLDGASAFGQVAGQRVAEEAGRRAVDGAGLGMASVRRAGHLGRIGAYTEVLAADGLVALAFCSIPPQYHNVAWFGAREGRLGTNPISYAFPSPEGPVVADLATSATPEGKVRSARNLGEAVPPGLLRDAEGRPTTDPNALYTDPPGTLQPLGGDQGHKGTALGLLVEVMATLLPGEAPADAGRGNNLTVLAVATTGGFADVADRLVAYVRSAPPIDRDRPVMLPGEPERRAREAATEVLVDGPTWEALTRLAAAAGVTMP